MKYIKILSIRVFYLLLRNGKLKIEVAIFLGIFALCLIILPWLFDLNRSLSYLLFCVGSVIGVFAGKSDRFGNKSFTNDPLGWRKAKETYNVEDTKEKSEMH